MWLKDCSESIVIVVGDGVVFVVMTFGTIHGEAEKGFAGVFDGTVEPRGAIKKIVVSGQETGACNGLYVGWSCFIPCQHLNDHTVITLTFVK